MAVSSMLFSEVALVLPAEVMRLKQHGLNATWEEVIAMSIRKWSLAAHRLFPGDGSKTSIDGNLSPIVLRLDILSFALFMLARLASYITLSTLSHHCICP